MTLELTAAFEKTYPGGASVRAELRCPAASFSITALFGPSGCGKTTVLRCLAGLERPDRGHIHFADEVWFDARERIERRPQARDIGFLFQEYALFPHLTVAANVAYGLYALPAAERMRRVAEVLERFELSGLDARYPWQISGGQQQRVALARAIARRPRLLLLDEPLSALDTHLRETLRGRLRKLLAEFAIPVLIVTHDRMEAIALADQVLVLDDGAVRQTGTIHDVFSTPVSQRVAQLVGVENITVGRVTGVHEGLATVRVGTADLVAVAAADAQGELIVCIRGEEVVLQADANQPSSARNRLAGLVTRIEPEGPLVRVSLECGFTLTALITKSACKDMDLRPGGNVTALIKAQSIHLIPRS